MDQRKEDRLAEGARLLDEARQNLIAAAGRFDGDHPGLHRETLWAALGVTDVERMAQAIRTEQIA